MKPSALFFLREALKNLRMNLLMSLTAVTTTFICILVLGIAMLLGAHVQGLISSVQQGAEIVAYLPLEATPDEAEAVRARVEDYPEVEGVEYVSEEEALADFQRDYQDSPEIYENVGAGVLPASLELRLEDAASAESVAGRLQEAGFPQEEIWYPQKTVERFDEATRYIVWGLRGATALFLVSSVLLISNAIRLSIFARRKEIEVMKLVGASDDFVRAPFVLEGLVQGLIGAALAALVVIWLDSLFVEWSHTALPFLPISGDAVNTPLMLLVLASVGAAIGVLGSFLSVTRFLRV